MRIENSVFSCIYGPFPRLDARFNSSGMSVHQVIILSKELHVLQPKNHLVITRVFEERDSNRRQ